MDIDITRKPTSSIYYDSRISAQSLEPYKNLLESVFQGDMTHGANVEKLNHHHIFSVRTNNKGRILFTFQKINGQESLLVLEILENHEYDKSKFLKKNVLKKYLEKNQTELDINIQDADFQSISIPSNTKIGPHQNKITFNPAFDNNHGHIVLDIEQQAVFLGKTPMVIEGPPGSGKTSLAEGLIRRALDKNQSVLMVTRSARLARKIKENLSKCPEFNPNKVRIIAYNELFPDLKDNGKSVFENWYPTFNKTIPHATVDGLYEEFRILSGYDLNQYTSPEGLGQKQNQFQQQEDRKKIVVLYKLWLSHLTSKNIQLCDFYSPMDNEIQQYDLVVLDEAQDFSHLQLKNLTAFAKNKNMVTCIDRRQNIEDENPKIIYLKNMLTEQFKCLPNVIQFSTHYRCPQIIMNFAKVFNELRLELSPKLKAEPKIVDSLNQDGTLIWVEPNHKGDMALFQDMKNNPDVCVITHEKFKQEALERLGIIQVFTPEEIKGFEYKTVILYKILDTEKLYQVNTLLNPTHKNKAKEETNCSAELSSCFVAATRPTEALYFVQDSKQHNLKFLIAKLKNNMPLNSHSAPIAIEALSPEYSFEAWEARAKEAIERNDTQAARDILQKHANITDPKMIEFKIQEWDKEFNSEAFANNKTTKAPEPIKAPLIQTEKKARPRELTKKAPAVQVPEKKATVAPSIARPLEEINKRHFINAITIGNMKKIKKLLNKDKRYADIEYNGLSCLMMAACGHIEIVKKLNETTTLGIDSPADVIKSTPLIGAIQSNHPKICELLLQKGANINLQDKGGDTALMYAIECHQLEIVAKLLAAGADWTLKNGKGETALLLAQKKGHKNIVEEIIKFEEQKKSNDPQIISLTSSLEHLEIHQPNTMLTQYESINSGEPKNDPTLNVEQIKRKNSFERP